ncbi:uncharacterized protein [Watersipora subatra]|uniref:uncharacterized protein n=1 Tax=Watersipora subatra TaxID=2589382 RepID=UPI00355C7625
MGLLEELKQREATSDGFGEFCVSSCNYYKERSKWSTKPVAVLIITLIFIPGPIAEIVVGSLKLQECPAQNLIPIYCLCIGIFSIISTSLNAAIKLLMKEDSSDESSNRAIVGNAVQGLFLLLMFGWFIAGNVWIFSTTQCMTAVQITERIAANGTVICFSSNSMYLDTPVYCDALILSMVFKGTIVRWVLIALTFAIGCCRCGPIFWVYYRADKSTYSRQY